MIEIHWLGLLVIVVVSGSLGCFAMAIFASRRIGELIRGNRKLQGERDDAIKDAKNYRELLKIEQ